MWALIRKDELCDGPRLCNDHPYEHADDCPSTIAGELANCNSHFGNLLSQVLAIDFALEKGIGGITLDTLPYDQFQTLRLLQAERNKHHSELIEKSKHK